VEETTVDSNAIRVAGARQHNLKEHAYRSPSTGRVDLETIGRGNRTDLRFRVVR